MDFKTGGWVSLNSYNRTRLVQTVFRLLLIFVAVDYSRMDSGSLPRIFFSRQIHREITAEIPEICSSSQNTIQHNTLKDGGWLSGTAYIMVALSSKSFLGRHRDSCKSWRCWTTMQWKICKIAKKM
ncbi:hypothetical protein CEXT_212571 [Caerostris extrusa]|uniref:Uncharacterized protein n=1 Tax=Caerostris extrusa TaxID=172846 RepID=A0AAV4WTR1_CAEEX|nr:hypothetical protein CEXT_212571 [Caerostris extrusa]